MNEKIIATYDADSKRFHRFIIDAGQEVTGSIYVPKNKKVPEMLTIQLKSKKDQE